MTVSPIRFGFQQVGSQGWRSVWRGCIVTTSSDGTITHEQVGGEHLEIADALADARAVHDARQAAEPVVLKAA